MAELSYSRRAIENVSMPYPPPQRIATEVMDGRWMKTNDKPQWIDWLEVETVAGETYVHIRGSELTTGGRESAGAPDSTSAHRPPPAADWGRVKCSKVFASAPNTYDAKAGALIAHYDFEGMRVEVQANLNLGLLVVATFVTFKSPGPHADRFTREFFWRSAAAPGDEPLRGGAE